MNESNKSLKSQTDLIIEKFIENLESHPEFDNKTLSKLRELASSGNLTQYKKVEIAIKAQSGGENEDN